MDERTNRTDLPETEPVADQDAVTPRFEDAPALSPDPERRLGLSMLMKVALAAVLLSSLVITISCVMRANQLQKQSRELQAELDEYNRKIKELVYYLNEEVDDQYIIDYARDHLDMVFPDEEIHYDDINE